MSAIWGLTKGQAGKLGYVATVGVSLLTICNSDEGLAPYAT